MSALTKDILIYQAAWHLVDVEEEHTVIHCDVLAQRNSQGEGSKNLSHLDSTYSKCSTRECSPGDVNIFTIPELELSKER